MACLHPFSTHRRHFFFRIRPTVFLLPLIRYLSLFHTHTHIHAVLLLQGSLCIVVIVVVVYTMIHNIINSKDTITNAMTTSVLLGVCSIPDILLPVCVVFAKNDRFRIKQEHWGSILYTIYFFKETVSFIVNSHYSITRLNHYIGRIWKGSVLAHV